MKRRLSHYQIVTIRLDEIRRAGRAKEVTVAPIFRGEKRKHVIDRTMDVLRDWRLSPFEAEGTVRATMRSALCLHGYGWQRSDRQADDVVRAALHLLGAERPSYANGQKEYTEPREICAQCKGPLDDDDITARRRFCSQECRQISSVRDAERYDWLMSFERKHSTKLKTKALSQAKTCARPGCGNSFQSVNPKARYCCPECVSLDSRTVEARPCQRCGKRFRPRSNSDPGMFCSIECKGIASRGAREKRVSTICRCCGEQFEAATRDAMYCSKRCRSFACRMGRGEVAIFSDRVFDYLMIQSGARITLDRKPGKASPEALDWFFMEMGCRITAEVRVAGYRQ